MPPAAAIPELFTIRVTEEALADLHSRMRATRWPDDLGNNDGYYGVPGAYLRGLVDYWIDEFDWRAVERGLNAFTNQRVAIDGVPVHFVRQPGTGPASFGGEPADAFDCAEGSRQPTSRMTT